MKSSKPSSSKQPPSDLRSSQGAQSSSTAVLMMILAAAAVLRLWHLNWGLPEVYEEAYPFFNGWKMWNFGKSGFDFNPHFFNYPAFTFYLNFAAQGGHYLIGLLSGSFQNLESFQQSYTADPSSHLLIARSITVCFDLGIIFILAKFGELVGGKFVGYMAAAIAACNPLLIKQAHMSGVDTPLTFFALAALYCIYRIYRGDGTRWYLLAGICIGLGTASKYTGALLIPVLVLGHFFRGKTTGAPLMRWVLDISLIRSIGVAAITFVVFNPYIFLSFSEFRHAFSFEEAHMAAGHLGVDAKTSTAAAYFIQMLPQVFGWVGYGLILASLVYLLISKKKEYVLLLCFPLLYLLIISTWQMRAERYLLPAIPMLILAASIVLSVLAEWIRNRFPGSSAAFAFASLIAILLLAAEPAQSIKQYNDAFSLPDTRLIAKDWIDHHVPKGSTIAMTPISTVLFPKGMYHGLTIPFNPVDPERVTFFYQTAWYEDFDFLLGSDYDLGRYKQDSTRFRPFIQFYDDLRAGWKVAFEVLPQDGQSGPAIWLFQPPPTSRSVAYNPELFQFHQAVPPDSVVLLGFCKTMTKLLVGKERYVKAEQFSRRIVAIEKNDYLGHKALASVLFGQGKFGEAMTEAGTVLQMHPGDPEMTAMLRAIQGINTTATNQKKK